MIILTVRTDKPEAEIGLYDSATRLAYVQWQAHRELAETIHSKLKALLDGQAKDWPDIQGIVLFKGPGSFTGLRIGAAVANTLATSLNIPIVGVTDEDWVDEGTKKLIKGTKNIVVVPEYGADAHITAPKK